MSCVQFIERCACVHNKNLDPNSVNLDSMFPNVQKSLGLQSREEMAGQVDEKFEGLNLPKLSSMGVNDWFDPVFLQLRISKLLSYNDVSEAVSSWSLAETIRITERE